MAAPASAIDALPASMMFGIVKNACIWSSYVATVTGTPSSSSRAAYSSPSAFSGSYPAMMT